MRVGNFHCEASLHYPSVCECGGLRAHIMQVGGWKGKEKKNTRQEHQRRTKHNIAHLFLQRLSLSLPGAHVHGMACNYHA